MSVDRRTSWAGSRRLARALVAALALVTFGAAAVAAQDDASRLRELERQVEELRQQVQALQAQTPATAPAPPGPDATELARRIEVLASEIEQLKLGAAAAQANRQDQGMGPAASKVYRQEHGLAIGGYGEVLYQNFDARRDDGSAAEDRDELTLERAVLYVGYKLSDRWLFNSELEWEEGGEENSVEFAYLDYLWRPQASIRFGHLLMPMGFLNELHEPTVYLGAKRPLTEQLIIPSTWHQSGFGLFGQSGPLAYRTYVVTGFDASGFTADGLRDGRQEGEVTAEDLAWTGRLDWTPAPGVLVGGSAYVGNSGQGLRDAGGRRLDVATRIVEGHAEWRWRGLEARLLAARADLDDVARLDDKLGLSGDAGIGEQLTGWYAQAGYDVLSRRGSGGQLIPYLRYERLDTQHAVPHGFARNPASDRRILTYGLQYKPIEQVVFKLDFQDERNEAGSGLDQLNLGVGYVF